MRRTLAMALLFVVLGAPIGWARTACPPSASDSSVPLGISLVGQAGTPDPVGTVSYVIRGVGGPPVPGAFVSLDFSACTDVRVATDVVAPGTIVNCAMHTVSGTADVTGRVTFRIVGSGISGTNRTVPACLAAYADGVLLPPSIVSTFDLDGRNGVDAMDLSLFAGDLYSGQYRPRSDYDFDGRLDAIDLGLFARTLSGGGSVASGSACAP